MLEGTQTNPLDGLRPVRLVLGTLALMACAVAMGLVGVSSGSPVAELLAGASIALIAGTMLEWYFHLFFCHFDLRIQSGIFEQHHRSHHRLGGDPIPKPLWLRLGEQFVGQFFLASLMIALPTGLLTKSLDMTLGVLTGSLCISLSIAFLHHCYHGEILHLAFLKSSWFASFRARHLAHHKDLSKNINVVVPIADMVFGTYSAHHDKSKE